MESQSEKSTNRIVELFTENNESIFVQQSLLSGVTVSHADFERDIQDDELSNADPESCLDCSDCECTRWLEEFRSGKVRFLYVGARVTFLIPGTSTRALLGSAVFGVQSDSGEEYINQLWEQECDELEAKLEDVGIIVVPVEIGTGDIRDREHAAPGVAAVQ